MTDERLALTLRRFERALARIEAASARKGAASDPNVAGLVKRHERLRARTKEAIAAIDRLTGTA